jgi:uncharacterized membrane protein
MLAVASIVWIGVHVGIAGTSLRWTLARRLGERGFRALFSVLSVGAIAFLIFSFNHAATTDVWVAPGWLRWILAFVMLVALVLFVGSVTVRNPTMVGGEGSAGQHVRGMLRITRHPMLWSFALWAAVHVIGTGDTAAMLLFGAFLITALAGMPSIDAKLARRDPAKWRGLAAETSILPFAAIAQGRNRFVAAEIGWTVPLLAVAAWVALLFLHPVLFGLSALPG